MEDFRCYSAVMNRPCPRCGSRMFLIRYSEKKDTEDKYQVLWYGVSCPQCPDKEAVRLLLTAGISIEDAARVLEQNGLYPAGNVYDIVDELWTHDRWIDDDGVLYEIAPPVSGAPETGEACGEEGSHD